ncbi:cAMP-dependent protein kinase type II regulatory subunit [Holothuria leucospilota]|uniref:cAMP-dependent protein kinase type II regulatory subunit n=1 Tax=Holothuria leucospilota TaxID=206669 RepID=A0A9Q1CLE1_HOLLE|nr:cAMP-dependent protein kinase type II regulatory subunit [Holothuria leucospilota]
MNFEIPEGLTDLLQDFTVAVLRERPQPSELIDFAANYFAKLQESNRKTENKRGVTFSEPANEDEESDIEEPPVLPGNKYGRRKSVCAERYDPEADDNDNEPKVVYPKSDEQRASLAEAVKPILLFRALDETQMQDVLDAMFEKKTNPGDHVIDEGDDGDNFYVIDKGTFDILKDINGEVKKVGAYNNTGSFGELALMYNTPRAATIVATSEGILWALDRQSFRRIVLKNAAKRRRMYENLLESVTMLKSLEPYERMNLADALVSKQYSDGDCIISQGDDADGCYFVEEGTVRVSMKNKTLLLSSHHHCYLSSAMLCAIIQRSDGSEAEKEVSRITKGQYFGELALLTNKPRAASIYAVGDVKCAFLDVGAFERLLGPCKDIMSRNIDHYKQEQKRLFGEEVD